MDLTVADYEIDDATNNISSGYDPASQTINDELLSDIEALGTVEQTGRLYSRQVNFTINEQTRNNLKTYYTEERLAEFASYDPTFPAWKEGFDLALAGESGNYTVCLLYTSGLHDAQRGKRKMGRFVPTDKLLLHRWTHPRCCQNGRCLADQMCIRDSRTTGAVSSSTI